MCVTAIPSNRWGERERRKAQNKNPDSCQWNDSFQQDGAILCVMGLTLKSVVREVGSAEWILGTWDGIPLAVSSGKITCSRSSH